ncbi:hypothetical protein CL629_04505 [bacterium]|nr:hypothetical protein [bacterium]|tara:strand:- start:1400 stop:3811 length:2412 start_codon:yes stop_codon:yes gene_type:complete
MTREKTIKHMLHELEKRRIKYCILRNYEDLEEEEENDIDILVEQGKEKEVREITQDVAKENEWNIQERNPQGLYFILYRWNKKYWENIRFDIVTKMEMKGVEYLETKEVLERRKKHKKGFYIPGFEHEAIHLMAKAQFGNPENKEKYEKRIQELTNNTPYKLDDEIEKRIKAGARKNSWKRIRNGLWRRIRPTGSFIVIAGPDGVGKSTTAEHITKIFKTFHQGVEHMHLGFRPNILPARKGGHQQNPEGEESVRKMPGWIRFIYHTLDYILGYWFKIRPALARGKIVIAERYYYGFLVDPRAHKRYQIPEWLLRTVFFICIPKPKGFLLLTNDSKEIIKRRQEHSEEETDRQIIEYEKWGRKARYFWKIRTDKPADSAAIQAVRYIKETHTAWKKYAPYRLAVLASHPIQYQAPLWKKIAEHQHIDLKVYYCVDWGVEKPQYDPKFFNTPYKWDIPLLEGYTYEFLKNYSPKPGPYLGGCINPNIAFKLWKHKYDAVVIMGWMDITFWFAYLAALVGRTPVFLRAVSSSYFDKYGKRSNILLFLKKTVLRNLFRYFVSGFLAIGTRNRDFYLEYGVKKKNIFHFPYAVDNNFFAKEAEKHEKHRAKIRKKMNIDSDAAVILFAARFIPRRHPEHAIKAFEKLTAHSKKTNAHLLMVGDGEMMDELKKEVEEKELSNVCFVGFKNQKDLVKMYSISDVFVRADETIETGDWGATVNEAMACGLPIVCADAAASNVDLIQRGKNGYVYTFGDMEEFAGSISKVIQNKKQLESMKRKSKEIISKWSYKEDVEGILEALGNYPHRY